MPNTELSSWSRLTIPSPIVTGSISVNTCLTRGSCQSIENCRRKSIRRSAEATIRPCTTVATSQAIAYAYSRLPPWNCPCSASRPTRITRFHTAGASAGIENSS